MSSFKTGVLAIVLIVVAVYFGFSKANPFADPYELTAVFAEAKNLKSSSPVRIAGVDVGEVTKVEPAGGEDEAALVTMELEKHGLPIHEDAELQVRPRILLEGNWFVDVKPGSPAAGILEDGEKTVPVTQTSTSVQLGEILSVLDSDVRSDLRTALFEYGTKALERGGAESFNDAAPFFAPAYRNSALANDALLGQEPERDLGRLIEGQANAFGALAENPAALADLVTDLNTTAGALAREDDALRASIPELRDTLQVGRPALASVNRALPTLRAFSSDALPGVRSSPATLDEAIPWIRQGRGLVQERELKGLAADLRQAVPSLVRLNTRLLPFLRQTRALSSCTNSVLVPFAESRIPSIESQNTDQEVRRQLSRSLVGLTGESRLSDANTPYFHIQGVNPVNLANGMVEPAPPPDPNLPPPHRPDVPCETQEPPNLDAPSGRPEEFPPQPGASAQSSPGVRP